MDSKPPSRLDRATFDRVLQRAAELQAASKDIGDGLSEEEILALGTEVGIPAAHLQQALLEERTHVSMPEANGLLDLWIGPADFAAQRVVQGTPEVVGAALTKWMLDREHLVVQRGSMARITYEPMASFARGMRRIGAVFNAARGKPYLDKAELVTAVLTPLEAEFCHVSLGAALRRTRTSHTLGAAALGAAGVMLGAIAVVAGAPIILGGVVFAGLGLGAGAVAHTFRRVAERAQLGLERALDDLEHNPALPKLGLQQIGMGQVIKGIAKEVRKALEE